MNPQRLTDALRNPRHRQGGLVAYLVAGYPSPSAFPEVLQRVAEVADAIEVGVPFTDPMADGVSIQHASQAALAAGVDLPWILDAVRECPVPTALMGYLNPFLAHGPSLATDLAAAGVSALIVPDLPYEERSILPDVPLVQLVTPLTEDARMAVLCNASQGFVYCVTVTGPTGGRSRLDAAPATLDRARRHARLPVLAGFGIRHPDQVRSLAPHADGVIVGTALVECLTRGDDPGAFLAWLMQSEDRADAPPRAAGP